MRGVSLFSRPTCKDWAKSRHDLTATWCVLATLIPPPFARTLFYMGLAGIPALRYTRAELYENKAHPPMRRRIVNSSLLALCFAVLVACGGQRSGSLATTAGAEQITSPVSKSTHPQDLETTNTLWDLFNKQPAENTVLVNRYLWAASLEVLDFLPVQTVDPFTGVIATGYGTPPGGGRAYRATVLVDDPALEARSLNLALQTRNGPASAATIRAVEDAILTRARQLRVADSRL